MYKNLVLTSLLCLCLGGGRAQAFTADDARNCFYEAVNELRADRSDLRAFVERKLHLPTLKNTIAKRAWGKEYITLSASERQRLEQELEEWLSSTDRLARIDPNFLTLQRYVQPARSAFEVMGIYRPEGGLHNTFSMFIVTGCRVIDVTWNNAQLSKMIAQGLR
jgi:hypothetical protein